MLIVFIDYDVCKRLCDPAWSIFQYFFADTRSPFSLWAPADTHTHTHTHTHTDTKALLYPCCAWHARG